MTTIEVRIVADSFNDLETTLRSLLEGGGGKPASVATPMTEPETPAPETTPASAPRGRGRPPRSAATLKKAAESAATGTGNGADPEDNIVDDVEEEADATLAKAATIKKLTAHYNTETHSAQKPKQEAIKAFRVKAKVTTMADVPDTLWPEVEKLLTQLDAMDSAASI